MLNANQLVIREYQLESMPADTREDLLMLFEGLIRFEATVAVVDTPKDPFSMAQALEELLLMVDRCVMGYIGADPVAMMLIDKGAPYAIAALYVNDRYRSKGIGELLVGCLQSHYPTQQLTVDCYKGNTRALNFYHRLGFRFTERSGIMKGVRNAF